MLHVIRARQESLIVISRVETSLDHWENLSPNHGSGQARLLGLVLIFLTEASVKLRFESIEVHFKRQLMSTIVPIGISAIWVIFFCSLIITVPLVYLNWVVLFNLINELLPILKKQLIKISVWLMLGVDHEQTFVLIMPREIASHPDQVVIPITLEVTVG